MINFNLRRKLLFLALLIMIFVCVVTNQNFWIQWAMLMIVFFVLFIFDLIFLGDGQFIYEPNYR